MSLKDAIESLERRRDYLAAKLAADQSSHPRHSERQELGALTIAIEALEHRRQTRQESTA